VSSSSDSNNNSNSSNSDNNTSSTTNVIELQEKLNMIESKLDLLQNTIEVFMRRLLLQRAEQEQQQREQRSK